MRRYVFLAVVTIAGLFAAGLLTSSAARQDARATPDAMVATPDPSLLLYEADDEADFALWELPEAEDGTKGSWAVQRSMLVNDGYDIGFLILPPYTVPLDDYAVEAEAQIIRFWPDPDDDLVKSDFLLVARQGVFAGYGRGCKQGEGPPKLHIDAWLCGTVIEKHFVPGQEWHTYRLEVEGNAIRLFVDGKLELQELSNRALTGGMVGLMGAHVELGVRRFAVYSLPPQSQP